MIDEDKNVSIKIVTFENYNKLIDVERIFIIKIKKIDILDRFNDWLLIIDCKNDFDSKSKYDCKNRNHNHDVISKNWVYINWCRNFCHVAKNFFNQIDMRERRRLILSFKLSVFNEIEFWQIRFYNDVTKNIRFNEVEFCWKAMTTISCRRKIAINIMIDKWKETRRSYRSSTCSRRIEKTYCFWNVDNSWSEISFFWRIDNNRIFWRSSLNETAKNYKNFINRRIFTKLLIISTKKSYVRVLFHKKFDRIDENRFIWRSRTECWKNKFTM